MRKIDQMSELPEVTRYAKYYEHDGMLRAYANRAMLLAFLCVPSTLLALAFAVYVRIQPPIVIRVDQNGEATVLGRASKPSTASAVRPTATSKKRRPLSAVANEG